MVPVIVTLAVVGDIHGHWDDRDLAALRALGPDAVLFVGDFGNEDTRVVGSVASLSNSMPTAAILGNHDAWSTTLGAIPDTGPKPSYDKEMADGQLLDEQLKLLGSSHVGFSRKDLPQLGLSVVGGRPCSWGGSEWRSMRGAPAALYERFFQGLKSFAESTDRIVRAAAGAPENHSIVFLAHNGPTGLGTARTSIVGRDFHPEGGDHGDPDLEEAVAAAVAAGRSVPLVVFGHMHDKVKVDGFRTTRQKVASFESQTGRTVYFNAAVVPRRRGDARCFSLVTMVDNAVQRIRQVWIGRDDKVLEETVIYNTRSDL